MMQAALVETPRGAKRDKDSPTGRAFRGMVGSVLIALLLTFFQAGSARSSGKRPSSDGGPTEVRALVFVVDLDEINSAQQSFTANVFYRIIWKDARHAHDGSGPIVKPLDSVWNPSILIVNQQKSWRSFPEVVAIEPDGTVSYQQRVWGDFSQPLKLQEFPLDSHNFNITFITVGNEPDEVKFVVDESISEYLARDLSVVDWDITGNDLLNIFYKPIPSAPEAAGFNLEFTASRKPGYYMIKVIIPLVLIVMMSWMVFWIDPADGGTQIGVSMTAMLTLIAYRFAVGAMLPKVSYLTRLDWFILSSTILVFASMVEVVITTALSKHNKRPLARRIDQRSKFVFPLIFVGFLVGAFSDLLY